MIFRENSKDFVFIPKMLRLPSISFNKKKDFSNPRGRNKW